MFKFVIWLLITGVAILFISFLAIDESLSRYIKYIVLMAFAILVLTIFVKKSPQDKNH